jgi:hypothetical protein
MQVDWPSPKVLRNAIEKVLPCHQGSAWGPSPDINNPRAINPLDQESLAPNHAKHSHDQHTSEEEADEQSLDLRYGHCSPLAGLFDVLCNCWVWGTDCMFVCRSTAVASAPCKLELAQNASPSTQPTHDSCTVEPHLRDSGEATHHPDSNVAGWHSPLEPCQQNSGECLPSQEDYFII